MAEKKLEELQIWNEIIVKSMEKIIQNQSNSAKTQADLVEDLKNFRQIILGFSFALLIWIWISFALKDSQAFWSKIVTIVALSCFIMGIIFCV